MNTIELSPDQKYAWDLIQQGKNLFVTAGGGAGKSFLIDYIKENFAGRVLTVASTGIAANNVGGRTIHSQFLISTYTFDANDSASKISGSKREYHLRSAKLLVIDEVSMVSDSLLECVDKICKKVRNSSKPFGGLQVVLFGDFLQLPPIFKGNTANDNLCFNCDCWKEANIETILLSTNFRQKDDTAFLNILTRLRYNRLTVEDIAVLKAREGIIDERAVKLFSLNAEVDKLNNSKYDELDPKTEHSYEMVIWGGDNARVEAFKKDTLMEEFLFLRVGARVMMLANEDTDQGYLYNGALGTVIRFDGKYPVVSFDNGIIKIIKEKAVEITEKDSHGNVRILVSCTQLPLKLAWACSIHKSQGQTFDSVFVDCSSVFTDGQVYVAFSRARSLEGLFIKGFNPLRAKSNQKIVAWYEELERTTVERRKQD